MEEKMKRNGKDGFSSPRPEKLDRRMAATGWSNRRKVFAPLGAGGTHCQHDRQREDYYATHPIAAQQLLKVETFSRNIWECACGEGHLAKVFASAGYKVRATDLVKRGYRCGKLDFLKCTALWPGDIITNPPYKYAEAFITTALQLIPEGNKLALFLKLQFLEGKNTQESVFGISTQSLVRVQQPNPLCHEWGLRRCIIGNGIWMVCLGQGISWRSNYQVDQLGSLTSILR